MQIEVNEATAPTPGAPGDAGSTPAGPQEEQQPALIGAQQTLSLEQQEPPALGSAGQAQALLEALASQPEIQVPVQAEAVGGQPLTEAPGDCGPEKLSEPFSLSLLPLLVDVAVEVEAMEAELREIMPTPQGDQRPGKPSIANDDGWRWCKYGDKRISGNVNHQRCYYKCTLCNKGCPAKKFVDRDRETGKLLGTEYKFDHCHLQPTQEGSKTPVVRRVKRVKVEKEDPPISLPPYTYPAASSGQRRLQQGLQSIGSVGGGGTGMVSPVPLFGGSSLMDRAALHFKLYGVRLTQEELVAQLALADRLHEQAAAEGLRISRAKMGAWATQCVLYGRGPKPGKQPIARVVAYAPAATTPAAAAPAAAAPSPSPSVQQRGKGARPSPRAAPDRTLPPQQSQVRYDAQHKRWVQTIVNNAPAKRLCVEAGLAAI